jgi:predicted helicase
MSRNTHVKPAHKAIQQYYTALKAYSDQNVEHETALETAFQRLLGDTARDVKGWTLIPKQTMKVGGRTISPDGTLRDDFLRRGYWEAKDTHDNLDAEIQKKIAKGYPLSNIIFEDTRQAVLYQGGRERARFDLTNPQKLADLLNDFYSYTEPDIEGFDQAVQEFKERVPELAQGLDAKIKLAHKENARFQSAFDEFFAMCQTALNPNLSRDAVDEMLVQHLLTERLFRKIFDNQEFTRRNVIAAEVEKVIDALVSQSFNRDAFLQSLDRFYRAIEEAAHTLEEFTEKQHFLNTVYERFFQGYSVKTADTHGIVYTPQPIVDFMCASVAEVLETEFGLPLGSPGVNILDPCTGTGNFIVNLLHRIPKKDLPRVYREQLFANEVMLLPYYIAAMNIEHAYFELTGHYEPFEGLCFTDSLDLAEGAMRNLFAEANTARVERQKKTPITVVIGNPPYNVGQLDENDNNKNRKYPIIESRIRTTYAKDSAASNKNALSDAYVKFFRWAVDRLGDREGVVCLVTNNSFVDQIAFDGMRKHLMADFTSIYHLHMEGNVRQNPKLAGTIYNVFGIQVGVGITVAVRKAGHTDHQLFFERVEKTLRKEEKLAWLTKHRTVSGVKWNILAPNKRYAWLVAEHADEFAALPPLGSKETKTARGDDAEAVFKVYGRGIATCRDDVVYSFQKENLIARVQEFIEDYNSEVDRFRRTNGKKSVDNFVRYDKIKWSETLKANVERGRYAEFQEQQVRPALYRPFCKKSLCFNEMLIERRYQFPQIFPTDTTERENRVITVSDIGFRAPVFNALMSECLVDLHLCASVDAHQCFPFYFYDEDGTNRRENITDWSLNQFRTHYADDAITKWDIFYYVYGLLHHPGYRTKFADNLKRDLPRVPFAPDFRAFATAGKELARLHLDYEQLAPFSLKWVETEGVPLSYKVEDKMRLSKDKTAVRVNPSLTLESVPPETFLYRLGNRSALDWVIDQYQVTEDKRSGIRSDPNRPDDPEYIVRLVGQVVQVSVETVKIVANLPERYAE